ncbi:hypothetical protein WJX73_000312 [Symbiochloris irregularis]|uniref:Uncharacterized protein n=1 Tax=Symbiochloris irregularis TaxID=706552 RepID=A0AAW1NQ36_9CHLO
MGQVPHLPKIKLDAAVERKRPGKSTPREYEREAASIDATLPAILTGPYQRRRTFSGILADPGITHHVHASPCGPPLRQPFLAAGSTASRWLRPHPSAKPRQPACDPSPRIPARGTVQYSIPAIQAERPCKRQKAIGGPQPSQQTPDVQQDAGQGLEALAAQANAAVRQSAHFGTLLQGFRGFSVDPLQRLTSWTTAAAHRPGDEPASAFQQLVKDESALMTQQQQQQPLLSNQALLQPPHPQQPAQEGCDEGPRHAWKTGRSASWTPQQQDTVACRLQHSTEPASGSRADATAGPPVNQRGRRRVRRSLSAEERGSGAAKATAIALALSAADKLEATHNVLPSTTEADEAAADDKDIEAPDHVAAHESDLEQAAAIPHLEGIAADVRHMSSDDLLRKQLINIALQNTGAAPATAQNSSDEQGQKLLAMLLRISALRKRCTAGTDQQLGQELKQLQALSESPGACEQAMSLLQKIGNSLAVNMAQLTSLETCNT